MASVPPHEIALSALIANGPGENRHVTVVNLRPGGYVIESENGEFRAAWIALFPAEPLDPVTWKLPPCSIPMTKRPWAACSGKAE